MNKTYKYTLSSGEKKEITFDVGVHRLAISNANGEDGGGDIVKFAFDETNEQLIDCTFVDIKNAIESGKTVFLIRQNGATFSYEYNLVQYNTVSTEAVFSNIQNKEYLLENTAFYESVSINFTNETLTTYSDSYVLDHKIYDTAIAYEYDSTRNYLVGEYCIYEGKLYRCINATTGTFVIADWTATNVMREIPRIQYNYSTTERVVGTWINGKPLYETTMEILNWPRSSYTAYDFSNAGISDIDEIVSEAGAYIFANDTSHVQYPITVYGPANFDHYFYRTGAVFYYTYNSLPFKKIIYTIRYTKTTD